MAERQIVQELGKANQGPLAAAKVEFGNLIARDSNGYLVQAGDVLGQSNACGVCNKTVDNSAGVAGDLTTEYITGAAFWFKNDAIDPVAQVHLGQNAYIKNSVTVCASSGASNNLVAGIVMELDSSRGVKIYIGSR